MVSDKIKNTPNTITKYLFNLGMHVLNSDLTHWQSFDRLYNYNGFNISFDEGSELYRTINTALEQNHREVINLKTPFVILSHRNISNDGELFEKILGAYTFTSKQEDSQLLACVRDIECKGTRDNGYFRNQPELVPMPSSKNIRKQSKLTYLEGEKLLDEVKVLRAENLSSV